MRLATEIEFAMGFACVAPAMYRNVNVITVYSVMSVSSACNVSQLQLLVTEFTMNRNYSVIAV